VKKLKHHILPQQRTTAETLVEAAETPWTYYCNNIEQMLQQHETTTATWDWSNWNTLQQLKKAVLLQHQLKRTATMESHYCYIRNLLVQHQSFTIVISEFWSCNNILHNIEKHGQMERRLQHMLNN
jgi:hypothetical protein